MFGRKCSNILKSSIFSTQFKNIQLLGDFCMFYMIGGVGFFMHFQIARSFKVFHHSEKEYLPLKFLIEASNAMQYPLRLL